MKTSSHHIESVRNRLGHGGDCSRRFLRGARGSIFIGDLLRGTALRGRLPELSGRSVLLATRDQLAAALAFIELDGVARRVVLCPPGVPVEYFPSLINNGAVDAIVSDYELTDRDCPSNLVRFACQSSVSPVYGGPPEYSQTEWVLLTSGTSGSPKMIVHTLASLVEPIDMRLDQMKDSNVVWGTFYDIRRYGGLQILLRGILGRGSLVLSGADESVADHLARLSAHRVTHLSGTPSHWRRALMSPGARAISPRYIRLSGEIVDQAILNTLQSFYPGSAVAHAFASTEAGVAFEVNDGLAGFPESILGSRHGLEIKVANESLHIRSSRNALRYMDAESGNLTDEEGFVDTGDVVERRGDRCYFLGRKNGVINVGGLKVYPEEVEAVINSHPAVRMCTVRARRNSLTGALVSADVVLREFPGRPDSIGYFRSEILKICKQRLPAHKIPATIRCVPTLTVSAAGKMVRRCA